MGHSALNEEYTMCSEIRGWNLIRFNLWNWGLGSIYQDFVEGKSEFQEILKSCMGKEWGIDIGFSTRRACLKAQKITWSIGGTRSNSLWL